MRTTPGTLGALMVAGLLLSGCGQPPQTDREPGPPTVDVSDPAVDDPAGDQGGPAAGMCPHGTIDCVDADLNGGAPDDGFGGDVDPEVALADAEQLLGRAESELAGLGDVRVGARDGEHLPLTEDYVPGRKTVTLETGSDGVPRVTAVTVELPDGPETLSAG